MVVVMIAEPNNPFVDKYAKPSFVRPGLLDRVAYKAGVDSPLLRDAAGFQTIPTQEWPGLIEAGHGVSDSVWTVFNQGSVGSCAAESCNGGMQIVREMAGLPRVRFSPYAMYYRTSGGSDRGSTLSGNLKEARDTGCIPEELHPRSKGWRTRPSDEAYEAAKQYRLEEFYELTSWLEFGTALLTGWSVYYGISGHAIVATELIDTDNFWYLNSWDESWGSPAPLSEGLSGGFGKCARRQIQYSYGIYAFRSCTVEVDFPLAA